MPSPPSTQNMEVYSDSGPLTSGTTYSSQIQQDRWDHMYVLITFTLGSLTNIVWAPEFSHDGTTYKSVYDAGANIINHTLTATFDGWQLVGQDNNNTRLQPLYFSGASWRFSVVTTGTVTGSALTIRYKPFVVGNREV